MPAHNILVVVVDGLRASALGAYGNTSFPTPALDQFAAESVLFDWCYAPSSDLADNYRALLQLSGASFPQRLKSLGYVATLVTDEPALVAFPQAAEFENCLQLNETSGKHSVSNHASDMAATSFARFFATAADVVASSAAGPTTLVWLHSRGMYGTWDAPIDLQQSLLDETDPPPVDDVTPPDFVVDADRDPDAAFRYASAYAAQAMVLDRCWETLLEAVDATGSANPWLVVLLGARGYPLGEHGRVGGVDPRLYGEQLHVPWLIRFPDATGRLARNNQLVTHLDLAPLLIGSIESTSACALAAITTTAQRDALVAKNATGHRAIRNAEWCFRQNPDPSFNTVSGVQDDSVSSTVELFVRPDDRWEVNDVAKLCPDVVESLTAKLNELS